MAGQKAVFLEGNLMRHIAVMSLTSSVGLMAIFVVDFVDMIFISMLGKAELAAAVGYAGAILFFTSSFGIGVAIAAGALVARALGGGNRGQARAEATTTVIWGVVIAAVFAGVVWLNLRPLARLMGARGETLDLAVNYLSIIVPSLPFLVAGMVGGAVLRAHGDARRSMMATIWGGAVNAALDPVLIFGLGMELTGAALASVAARLTIGALSLWPLHRYHRGLLHPRRVQVGRALPPLLAIALPAILTQLATPIGQAYVTRSMAAFGEGAVAGMAIVGRLAPIAFGVVFALSGAVGPVIGQNFGAGQTPRVRRAFLDGLSFAAICTVVAALALYVLRDAIAALFEAEGMTLTLLFLFCGPLALAWFFNGAIFVANAAFNNLGHPYYSTWINWGRHTLGTAPPVILGAWAFGAPGVLIGQAAGGLVFAAVAVVLALRVIGRADRIPGPVPDPYRRQARLMGLFRLNR